jgi:hypothetical protein
LRKGVIIVVGSYTLFLFDLLLFHLLEEGTVLDVSDLFLLLLRYDEGLPTSHHALVVVSI